MKKLIFLSMAVGIILWAGLAEASRKQGASAARAPAKAGCAGSQCECEELQRLSQQCAPVINPADGYPRKREPLRQCYLKLLEKRREVLMTRQACSVLEKVAYQIDESRVRLYQLDQHPALHTGSRRSLDGFGMDLMGHLGGAQRTPAGGQ